MSVPGYSYAEFCQGIAERDGESCWVHKLLVARRTAQIEAWASGHTERGDTRTNWIPVKLLSCDGQLDGHHVGLSKSWLKREFPAGTATLLVSIGPRYKDDTVSALCERSLADLLNDPRNGVCACRRHHDMLEAHLIVVHRGDLPEHIEEFAAELGPKAVARLERDFGRVPVSPVERV
jgi:hypothetical protein